LAAQETSPQPGAAVGTMAVKRLVVVGASSGGIEALRTLAAGLPEDFPAPICVVVHTSPESPGVLDVILQRAGPLPAEAPVTGDQLREGRIYVAPPDHHLLVEPGALRLSRGPTENRFRPAIDPLFRSAAQVYGPSVIGVILSGNLDDGVAGLRTIKQLGGLAVVQDPADALFPSMPQNALQHVDVDHRAPVAELGALLTRLVRAPHEPVSRHVVPKEVEIEVNIANEHNAVAAGIEDIGEPSSFACPECHGVLLRLKRTDPVRFRCHTGHAYSAESLLAAVNEGIEEGLWNAVRALEEGHLLLEHLAAHARRRGDAERAMLLSEQVASAKEQSETLRRVVTERAWLVASRPLMMPRR
jgi:two-component system, chemotaxis family, protein-glutamate methylesterase/glutaminase